MNEQRFLYDCYRILKRFGILRLDRVRIIGTEFYTLDPNYVENENTFSTIYNADSPCPTREVMKAALKIKREFEKENNNE